MGFSSGLPLPLTVATLSFWLAEAKVSLTTIGLFALIGVPYSIKFIWSPLIDRLPLPGLTASLGRRRSWALAIQALLALAILALGATDPATRPFLTALAALSVAFLSASQDIVIDAFRIELLAVEDQGNGAAVTQWGYRLGMLASSAGALYAAEFGGWFFAFALMAALMGVGIVTVWLVEEPDVPGATLAPLQGEWGERVWRWLGEAVVAPFLDLIKRQDCLAILLFILFYKFGDALAGRMANPLYVELGFSKSEVASISKLFGLVATLAGLGAGGALVYRIGIFRSLLLCGLLQIGSNLTYLLQYEVGHHLGVLTLTIFIENFVGGMESAAFVAYLSQLCNRSFTATQYALLSSLASVGRTMLSASAGDLVERLGWELFFVTAATAAVPGLLLLVWLIHRTPAETVRIGPALRT